MRTRAIARASTRRTLVVLLLASCGQPSLAAAQCPEPSAEQRAMADEINQARMQPATYADIIERHFAGMNEDGLYLNKAGRWVQTNEGQAAVDEAVAFLRKAAPMPALPLDRCLSQAANDHVADTGPSGNIGHVGTDGGRPSDRASRRMGERMYCGENISYGRNTPREHIIALLVDDGVASRGHRDNLFAPRYRSLGVGIGPHERYGTMTVHVLCLEDLSSRESSRNTQTPPSSGP